MMIVDVLCRIGFTRRGHFAMLLAVVLSPLLLVGCASEYVQLASSAQDDLNNGIQLIREKNAPMTKAVGLPPMTLSRLPAQTLRDADRYFLQAEDASDAAVKSFDAAEDAAQKRCDTDPDLDCNPGATAGYGEQLKDPGWMAQSLHEWISAVMEMHEAERLRVAGKEADALKKAYDAYEQTDPRMSGGFIVSSLGDSLHDRTAADAMAIDHYAAMLEIMKIRLGPEAVAHPRQMASNPLYWYQSAALEARLYNWDVYFANGSTDEASRAENRARVRDQSRLALKDLRKAFELGFHDWRGLAADPDFKSLRKLPEFQRLVTHYRGLGHSD